MPDPQTVIRDKQLRLRQIEAQYIRTKEFLKSPEWNVKRDEVLMRLSQTLGFYKYGQDTTCAVFILGQAKQIILEIQEVTDVIVEYEATKAQLERYNERMG